MILSALDAKIRDKIMHNCIIKYLQNKTRILVTHSLDYLYLMDRIILLKGGEIIFNGTFEQIQKENFYINLSKEPEKNKYSEIENIKEENIEELKLGQDIKKLTLEEDEEICSVKLSVYNIFLDIWVENYFYF